MAHIRAASGLDRKTVRIACGDGGEKQVPCDDSEMDRPVSYGDIEREVRSVAVAMESTPRALQQASELGCDLFIAHHETFGYPDDTFEAHAQDPVAIAKKDILDSSGMVVIRVHGTWDLTPGIGVFDTWVRLLGFEDCEWEPCVLVPKWEPWIRSAVFMKKLHIPGTTLGELARHVAGVVAPYGQNGVLMTGDPELNVRTLGVGDGGITEVRSYIDSGCDAGIITYMGGNWWADSMGIGLLYVEHTVSELQGMRNLAEFLTETLPATETHYIDNGCPFTVVSASNE